jgi:flagellar M-ring protein FliF
LETKLVAMLEPTVGGGNVRATVNVSYDESSIEKTDDVVDPTQVATLTMHKSEQTRGGRSKTTGVPGTASNTPGMVAPGSVQAAGGAVAGAAGTTPAAATVPPLLQTPTNATAGQATAGLPVYPQSGALDGMETATDESNSYAVTRHQVHMEQGPGRIRRVTAAVVVNDRMSTEGAGKTEHTVWKPRTPEEMQRLEQLARAAVGFDTTRGDEVVIENVGFSSNVAEVKGPVMQRLMDGTEAFMGSQPELLKTVSVIVIGMILILLVLKPMTNQMMTAMKETPPMALPAGQNDGRGGIGGRVSIPQNMLESSGRQNEARGVYEHVSDYIRKEPAQSTRLLESWIGSQEEN